MKTKKRNRARPDPRPGRCPYCGAPVVMRSADGVYKENGAGTMLYICSRYPICDAYVRILPGTKTPVGSLADGHLRALRLEAHQCLSRLYRAGIMDKDESYRWLASILQAPLSQTHIGYLGDYSCRRVIEESTRMLENWNKAHDMMGGARHAAG